MDKLLVICGPTATGKTALGIHLAKKFNGEIVSADSRQVYKGMDIGTGKDFNGAWLLDVVKPNQEFSVAQYVELAWKVITDIWNRGKLPIMVGGTGFYIKGVIDGIETIGVPPDWELRDKLKNKKTEELKNILKKLDPERWERMNESDRNNPRRLIRAIEIALAGKRTLPLLHKLHEKNILFIGLKASYPILYQRIDQRVEERVKQGVEKEIRQLLSKGYSWDNSVLGATIGYREWQPYFEKKSTSEEVIQKWKFAEHGYARRQLTWFKKDRRIHWFDITKDNWREKVEQLVNKWYNQIYASQN